MIMRQRVRRYTLIIYKDEEEEEEGMAELVGCNDDFIRPVVTISAGH